MKICFFIPSLDGGGAQRQCIAMLNELQHMPPAEIHLILLGSAVHDDSLDQSNIKLHRIEVRNFASPFALAFVVRTINRIRPDVLISWLHPADIWAYVATRFVRGVPWVMTERGSVYPSSFMFNLRFRIGRRAADAIVANSDAGKRLWDMRNPHSPVHMIPNLVIRPASPPDASASRAGAVECLYVGRLVPEKNVCNMTSAFTHFASSHPEARLIVAGTGPTPPSRSARGTQLSEADKMIRIAESGGVASRVEMLGFRKDVDELMSRARVMLSFSQHEGMPNVLVEAIVAGLPAVVSDIAEHRAILGDDYPYYVRLDCTPGEAAAVISDAWESKSGDSEHVYAYARRMLASMTPQKIVEAYMNVFSEVAARKASQTHGGRRRN